MNIYFELLKKPVFTMEYVNQFYKNINSARSAIGRLLKQGLVKKIKNNLYTCISGETNTPVANRFQIASSITPTSYVSHHSAMEYYGIMDQVFYEVYVSSETLFKDFTFDGYTYRCVLTKQKDGVEEKPFSGGVEVTDKERTVVDSIKDMDKIAGLEEVVSNIECIGRVDEKKLLKYISAYHNQFLYQKTGFLLEKQKEEMGLSEDFFCECQKAIGKSKRYLTSDIKTGNYNSKWKLVIPKYFDEMKNGVILDADV